MIYYDIPQVTVSWDEDLKAIISQWKAYSEGEIYRAAMDKGLDLLKQKKCGKVLVDSRLLRVVNQDDQKWTIENWTPRALAAGLRYSAFLIPKSALAQMSLKRMVNNFQGFSVENAYFDNVEEAREWLRSKK